MTCAKCDELQERVRQLEVELYGDGWTAPEEFRLTRMEAGLLRTLLARDRTCTHEFLIVSTRRDGGKVEYPSSNSVDAKMCHLRSKLKPFGLVVETVWGIGYRLSAESRQRLLHWNLPTHPAAEAA